MSTIAFGLSAKRWVQMYPKDSWTNVTNEYEPYSFNDYGHRCCEYEIACGYSSVRALA